MVNRSLRILSRCLRIVGLIEDARYLKGVFEHGKTTRESYRLVDRPMDVCICPKMILKAMTAPSRSSGGGIMVTSVVGKIGDCLRVSQMLRGSRRRLVIRHPLRVRESLRDRQYIVRAAKAVHFAFNSNNSNNSLT